MQSAIQNYIIAQSAAKKYGRDWDEDGDSRGQVDVHGGRIQRLRHLGFEKLGSVTPEPTVRYGRRIDDSGRSVLHGFEAAFEALADRWVRETALISVPGAMFMHEAYQQIIGMGPLVLPQILRRLSVEGGHWFWALRCISREDPVPVGSAGDVSAMTQAWLNWGRSRGLL